ncbi:hypothetical protein BH18ACT4_BH18ACT4_07720 [soil metagenome]
MELTPQLINEEEFSLKVRGYDPDQVDVFLEKVAVGVGKLLEQLSRAAQRSEGAERRAAELEQQLAASSAESTGRATADADADAETIHRTLLLAQRTADAAVSEAEEAAARTLSSAQEEAAQLLSAARAQAEALVSDAETEASRSAEDTRQRLIDEIMTLETSRDGIRNDVTLLGRYLDEQRHRLRSSVAELQRIVDDPARLELDAEPQTTAADLGEFAAPTSPAPPASAATDPVPGPSSVVAADPGTGPSGDDSDFGPVTASYSVGREAQRWSLEEPVDPRRPGEVDDDRSDFDARRGDESDPSSDASTAPAVGDADAVDDSYLAELRKAMVDDRQPLAVSGLFDQDDDDGGTRSRRFGRGA